MIYIDNEKNMGSIDLDKIIFSFSLIKNIYAREQYRIKKTTINPRRNAGIVHTYQAEAIHRNRKESGRNPILSLGFIMRPLQRFLPRAPPSAKALVYRYVPLYIRSRLYPRAEVYSSHNILRIVLYSHSRAPNQRICPGEGIREPFSLFARSLQIPFPVVWFLYTRVYVCRRNGRAKN